MSSVVKPKGSLKDYLDSQKRKTRLLQAVEQHVLNAPEKPRSTRVLHPSEIVKPDWCHRASYYALSGNKVKKAPTPFRLMNTFDEGHYIHAKWQQRFREMGSLVGTWRCLVCRDKWWGTSPQECPHCGNTRPGTIEYGEVTLKSHEKYGITGHADGWITGVGDDCLIEIKSIGFGTVRMENPKMAQQSGGSMEEAWKMIRSPFRSHLLQGNLYLELGHQMVDAGLFDSFPDEIVYLYEFKLNQDHKEFVVTRDREVVRDILVGARNIVQAVDNSTPPPCNLDSNNGCQKCRAYEEQA